MMRLRVGRRRRALQLHLIPLNHSTAAKSMALCIIELRMSLIEYEALNRWSRLGKIAWEEIEFLVCEGLRAGCMKND